LSDRSGNSGYPRLGDTGSTILQKASELSFSITENLFLLVAILVKWIASSVQPLLFVLRDQIFCRQAVIIKFVAGQYTTFD
jgi:hypothetical protein